jgi:hypothetical protein
LRLDQLIAHTLVALENNAVARAYTVPTHRPRLLENGYLPDVAGRVRVRNVVVRQLKGACSGVQRTYG